MHYFHAFAQTDPGRVRARIEDHILAGRLVKNRGTLALRIEEGDDIIETHGLVFAVADGVGGAGGGDLASRLALTAFDLQFHSATRAGQPVEAFQAALQAAAERANHAVLDAAAAAPEYGNMGATLAGVCIAPFGCLIFHAGDSRVYRLRNGFARQLTQDDSVASLAAASGLAAPGQSPEGRFAHTITNCIGSEGMQLHMDSIPPLRENDMLLITSDGVHDLISQDALEAMAARAPAPEPFVTALVQAALDNGGHDNISAIALQFAPAITPSVHIP